MIYDDKITHSEWPTYGLGPLSMHPLGWGWVCAVVAQWVIAIAIVQGS